MNRQQARRDRRQRLQELLSEPRISAQLEVLLDRHHEAEDRWNAHLNECAQCDAAVNVRTEEEVRRRSCAVGNELADAMDGIHAEVEALVPGFQV
jgi:hypothetical protein